MEKAMCSKTESTLSMDCLCEGFYYWSTNDASLRKSFPQESSWEKDSWYAGELQLFESLSATHLASECNRKNKAKLILKRILSWLKFFK